MQYRDAMTSPTFSSLIASSRVSQIFILINLIKIDFTSPLVSLACCESALPEEEKRGAA